MNRGKPNGEGHRGSLRAVDRYLVPHGAPQVVRHFLDHLFVSHGRRERFRHWTMARLPFPAAAGSLFRSHVWEISTKNGKVQLDGPPPESMAGASWRSVLPLLQELVEHSHVLKAVGLDGFPLHRSIFLHDYGATARERTLVFSFSQNGLHPAAVVKLRNRSGAGRPLRTEWEALRWVGSRLHDPALAETVPEPLQFLETPVAEILVLSHLKGRSAYWDQQNRLLPGRCVRPHMRHAAGWLARFHRALAIDPTSRKGPSHGDFWARNLLVGASRGSGEARVTGVVDWEHFDPEGCPHHDLFHFPLAYARIHPRHGIRTVSLPEAFRRAFLEKTPLAREVGIYLSRYCAMTGLPPNMLESHLRDYLGAQAGGAGPSGESEAWLECLLLLDRGHGVVPP